MLNPFLTTLCLVLLWLFPVISCHASVEVGRLGEEPVIIEDVYQREGTSFVAIDDVLATIGVEGDWDSVAHVYRIHTPSGHAVISPGSQFLRLGEHFVPVAHRPRFIDGKLRVSEVFLLRQLNPLLSEPIYYRNHNPADPVKADDPLDRLFAFLLRKKAPVGDQSKRIVAIDPGHGGQDPGALGHDGSKEKTFTLAVGQRLEKLLKMHQDAPVVMTRDDDYAVTLDQRLSRVVDGGADVLVSLHAQAFFSDRPFGITLYIQPETERDLPDGAVGDSASRRLADDLNRAFLESGFTVHGVRELPVYPLGRGDLPRVMVEMGSLTNHDDLAMLQDPTRQQDLARALHNGLRQFFRTYQEPTYEQADETPTRFPDS